MAIGERIKYLREQAKISQTELAEKVNTTKQNIYKYEKGIITNIPSDRIELIANALNTTPAYLMGWNDGEKQEKSNIAYVIKEDIYNIPLFESVSAGFGATAQNCIIDYIPTVIHNPYEADETIAIIVSGDSMYPKIEDGDTIVVHKQTSVDSGQIAVVLIDGEDAVVKKVKYGADWVDLISINPEYKTRHFEKEELERLRVLGLVRQIIKMV